MYTLLNFFNVEIKCGPLIWVKKVKSAYEPSGSPGLSLSRFLWHEATPKIFLLVYHRVTPALNFASTHLYTRVERGTVRVKCFAQEHNTMSPARPRTRTARSRVERTNQEATAPLPSLIWTNRKFLIYITN